MTPKALGLSSWRAGVSFAAMGDSDGGAELERDQWPCLGLMRFEMLVNAVASSQSDVQI